MESTRPIRALMRGLEALTVLNIRDGATVSEIAHDIRLPRTTVYRILETLCNTGFVFRDTADDRYRLTILVRGLSNGFADEMWVTQTAKPHLDELGRELVWPVSIATPWHDAMMVRATTDHETPLAIEHHSAGMRMPLLTSSAGRVYLAFSATSPRDTLVDPAARSPGDEDLQAAFAEIRAQGFASTTRSQRMADEISVSVPVNWRERVLAVLTIRFLGSAVPLKLGLERFLPKLRLAAARIATSYSEKQAQAQSKSAPEAAA